MFMKKHQDIKELIDINDSVTQPNKRSVKFVLSNTKPIKKATSCNYNV